MGAWELPAHHPVEGMQQPPLRRAGHQVPNPSSLASPALSRTKGDASKSTGRRSSPAPSYLASRDASQQHTERGNRIANSDMAGHSGRRAGTTSAQIGAHLGVFMPRETGGELRNGPNPRGGKRGTESRTSFYSCPTRTHAPFRLAAGLRQHCMLPVPLVSDRELGSSATVGWVPPS